MKIIERPVTGQKINSSIIKAPLFEVFKNIDKIFCENNGIEKKILPILNKYFLIFQYIADLINCEVRGK